LVARSVLCLLLGAVAWMAGCDTNSNPDGDRDSSGSRSSVTTPDFAWTVGSLPPEIRLVNDMDCTESFCAATGQDSAARANILLSSDNGRTWAVVARLENVNNLSGIACRDESDCLALGRTMSREPIIVQSADAGKTWIQGTIEIPGMDVSSVACSRRVCIASGTSGGSSGIYGMPTVFLAPVGSNWRIASAPDQSIVSYGATYCLEIECWVIGNHEDGRTYVFRTSDGLSWSRLAALPRAGEPSGMACVDSHRCLVVGVLSSAITENGGKTWQDVPMLAPISGLLDVSCDSGEGCMVAAADQGLAAFDRGALRSQSLPNLAGQIASISCANGTCVASGFAAGNGDPPIFVGARLQP
jgi:photosystem II stability/assembly factor-like uncharacterized protein